VDVNPPDAFAQTAMLAENWMAGDLTAIGEVVNADLAYDPSSYRQLIERRNKQWLVPLGELLAEDASALVIVGVGHLTGPASLVTLLEQHGFRVEIVSDPAMPEASADVRPGLQRLSGATRR
jgi:uncharacterized protein YbaP (TraB family)